jgi:hypothetical protein
MKEEPGAADAATAGADGFDSLSIPAGTVVHASLDAALSTAVNRSRDTFTATTTEAISVDGRTLMPAGSKIEGVLRDVESSGRIEGRARMTLGYQSIVDPQGARYGIGATPLALQAASGKSGDIEKIAAGAVLGAVIGGIANGGTGAAIGAGAGAGAGTIYMLATKGADIELGAGQALAVQITSPTRVQVASR